MWGLPARQEGRGARALRGTSFLAFLDFGVLSKHLLLTLLPDSLHLIRSFGKLPGLPSAEHTTHQLLHPCRPHSHSYTCPCHTLAGHGPQQGVIVAENKGGEDRKLTDATCPGAWGQSPTCLSVLCGVTGYEFLEDPEALPLI